MLAARVAWVGSRVRQIPGPPTFELRSIPTIMRSIGLENRTDELRRRDNFGQTSRGHQEQRFSGAVKIARSPAHADIFRSEPDSNWRFRLSGTKTADFFKFAISEGSHRPRQLVRVLRNSSKSCQGRGRRFEFSLLRGRLSEAPSRPGATREPQAESSRSGVAIPAGSG